MDEGEKTPMDGQEAQEVEEKSQDEGKYSKGEEEKDGKEDPTSPKLVPKYVSIVSHPSPEPNLSTIIHLLKGID